MWNNANDAVQRRDRGNQMDVCGHQSTPVYGAPTRMFQEHSQQGTSMLPICGRVIERNRIRIVHADGRRRCLNGR